MAKMSIFGDDGRDEYKNFVATIEAAAVLHAVISVPWIMAFISPVMSFIKNILARMFGFGGCNCEFFGNAVTNLQPSELNTLVSFMDESW